MAQSWESDKIKDLGKQYERMAAAGAPNDVLTGIHNQAEKLRSELGYSGGNDGSKVTAVSTGSSRRKADSAGTVESRQRVTVIGSEDDFSASSYDFTPLPTVTQVSSSGSLDGGAIAGYVITALVLVVILDKLVG